MDEFIRTDKRTSEWPLADWKAAVAVSGLCECPLPHLAYTVTDGC